MSTTEEVSNSRKRPAETELEAVDAAPVVTAAAATPTSTLSQKPSPTPKSTDSKIYKGLRQFSMMVCKKVEEKGTTTYNEVADELVVKVLEDRRKENPEGKFDEKNIRRRVYDALNVLMAMDIITKDKKEISWKGLPSSASQDLDMLGRERDFRQQEVERKRQALQDLLVQQVCFRNLLETNRMEANRAGENNNNDNKIPLPFIVVNTHSSAVIQCNMSPDLTDVMFDFSMPFEINDDNTILKRLGMHKTSMDVLQDMLPEDMVTYCQQHHLFDSMLQPLDHVPASAAASRDYHAPYSTNDALPPVDTNGMP